MDKTREVITIKALIIVMLTVVAIGLTLALMAFSDPGERAAAQVLGGVSASNRRSIQTSKVQDEAQVRALQTLIKAQELLEQSQSEVELNLVAKYWDTPEHYQLMTQFMREEAQSKGEKAKLPNRSDFLAEGEERTKWAFSMGKIRNETRIVVKQDGAEEKSHHYLAVYDGENSYEYTPERKHGEIKSGEGFLCYQAKGVNMIMGRPFEAQPLSRLLARPGVTYAGREVVQGVNCHKVQIPRVAPSIVAYTLWFSPEHSYRLMRARRVVDQIREGVNLGYEGGSGLFEVQQFKKFGEIWVPSEVTYSSFIRTDGRDVLVQGTQWWLLDYRNEARGCRFQLEFPLGTEVFDLTTGKSWTEGQSARDNPSSLEASR